VPTPRVGPAGERLLVVDVGWPAAAALATTGWVGELLAGQQLVVVCRVSVPGVRQAEQLLTELPRPPLIAAVGPVRWPGVVTASCGPGLRAARAAGRVVGLPTVRPLEVTGLTADPLPRPVASAGGELAALIRRLVPAVPALTDETEEEQTSHGD
jgi:hypothetical protein